MLFAAAGYCYPQKSFKHVAEVHGGTVLRAGHHRWSGSARTPRCLVLALGDVSESEETARRTPSRSSVAKARTGEAAKQQNQYISGV